jgi:hypothetical protein
MFAVPLKGRYTEKYGHPGIRNRARAGGFASAEDGRLEAYTGKVYHHQGVQGLDCHAIG